ncbi:unnamed protein product [Prunus armeniaca]
MYLARDAKLWWRARVQEVTSGGRPTIDEWVVLKKELRAQFLPCNAQSELKRQDVKSFNSAIAATERLMDYIVAVTSSGKKEQGGNKHLDNKPVDKCKETKVVLDGDKGEEHKDKKKFLGCFLCQGPHLVKDYPKRQNLHAIVTKRDGGAEESSSL